MDSKNKKIIFRKEKMKHNVQQRTETTKKQRKEIKKEGRKKEQKPTIETSFNNYSKYYCSHLYVKRHRLPELSKIHNPSFFCQKKILVLE